jgi:hypothetical protein
MGLNGAHQEVSIAATSFPGCWTMYSTVSGKSLNAAAEKYFFSNAIVSGQIHDLWTVLNFTFALVS